MVVVGILGNQSLLPTSPFLIDMSDRQPPRDCNLCVGTYLERGVNERPPLSHSSNIPSPGHSQPRSGMAAILQGACPTLVPLPTQSAGLGLGLEADGGLIPLSSRQRVTADTEWEGDY